MVYALRRAGAGAVGTADTAVSAAAVAFSAADAALQFWQRAEGVRGVKHSPRSFVY